MRAMEAARVKYQSESYGACSLKLPVLMMSTYHGTSICAKRGKQKSDGASEPRILSSLIQLPVRAGAAQTEAHLPGGAQVGSIRTDEVLRAHILQSARPYLLVRHGGCLLPRSCDGAPFF